MFDRAALIREIIAEYESLIKLEVSRLDNYMVEHARLKLAAEIIQEFGGDEEELREVKRRLHCVEHRMKSSERYLERLERLLNIFRAAQLE
ncbi:MAG: hypothetical protein M1136_00615 [Chloroflexi bacterium]|nr:hypothetical protein [Chloroflexota bacterium]